tara:strand:- start:165 stop:380 length:216 start_codon:yes stop_codon:yes gene_type:complete
MILARKTGNWRRTAKLTDKHLYNCTKCNRAWEYSISEKNVRRLECSILYYNDFPKYGKKKKVCKNCNKGVK